VGKSKRIILLLMMCSCGVGAAYGQAAAPTKRNVLSSYRLNAFFLLKGSSGNFTARCAIFIWHRRAVQSASGTGTIEFF
jgi:hypothetical protein